MNNDEYNYTKITGPVTTQVFSGQGTFYNLVITETAAGTISLSDATSGTTEEIGVIKASAAEGPYGPLSVRCSKGLRVGLTAASKIIVAWKQ